MQTKKFLSLLLALVMMFSLTVTASAEEEAKPLEGQIVILHTNDVHGAIGSYAKVAALKQSFQDAGAYTLLLDAGDYIQGDPTVSVSQGKTAIELMNLAGYDAATIGNHEFDYGYPNFKEITKDAKFPVVAANVLVDGKAETTHTIFTAEGGQKIGVFGLSTPETATKAHPAKIQGVTFPAGKDMFAIAEAEVKALEDEGCDYIVCLAHLGIDDESKGNRSIDLLEAVEGIDVLIDGHSHSTLDKVAEAAGETLETMEPQGAVITGETPVVYGEEGKTLVTSTGTKLANVGVVVLSEEVTFARSVPVESIAVDGVKEIADRAAAIQKQIDDDYGAAFAKTEVLLNGDKDPGNRTEETNLGDLITDALVWGAEKNGESVDAAVTNGGGIRAPIAAGDITKKDVNTVLPFGNTLSIVKVTGAELLEALEASTHCTPTAIGGFPQVSGIEFTVDTAKEFKAGDLYPGSTYHKPASIERVTITSVGGKDFDEKAEYSIATNDFMAAGGDTYYAFASAKSNYDLGLPMDEVLMDYIKEELKGVVTAEAYGEPAGRITIEAAPAEEAPAEEAPAEEPAPVE
ncbi:bifunctional metallophosphatase/5'-nucleotidase, partial [Oscillibacter sp.]|uniref:bifunctional metallophosphatase/5'-nucleotidase n=1 Tax=Oscillibacter sp. TaxID=1945593 RepID=UPI002D80E010